MSEVKKRRISRWTIEKFGRELALEIYGKCDYKCSECSTEEDLLIHHIDHKGRNYEANGLEPNDSPDNLIIMCRTCHGRLHSRVYWDEKLKEQGGYLEKGNRKEYYQKMKHRWRTSPLEETKERRAEYSKIYQREHPEKNREKVKRHYYKKKAEREGWILDASRRLITLRGAGEE